MFDGERETYNKNNQINFKNSMLKSSLCDYSDANIHVSGTITVTRAGADDPARRADERERLVFKNFAPFTDCISKINNTQRDIVQKI